MNKEKGTFYAVGVGPGDPELMTRQACAVLERCPVIAAPKTRSGRMLALDIARGSVCMDEKTVLALEFTMSRDEAVRLESYRTAAEEVARELDRGQDVAMVNLGDVSVYATAYYILDAVRALGYDTVMIPGVTSFSAVAARLGCSLTEPERPLHILPGGERLDEALALPGTKVLMKSGSAVHDAVRALDRAGLLDRAGMVADCGLPSERVFTDLRELPEDVSYFATVIVH